MSDQPTAPGLRDQLTALVEKWRERAVAAIKAYGLYAASGAAFTKCADELASALREAAALPDTKLTTAIAFCRFVQGRVDVPEVVRGTAADVEAELREVAALTPQPDYDDIADRVDRVLKQFYAPGQNRDDLRAALLKSLEWEAASSTLTPVPLNGVALIQAERQRQVSAEGWTPQPEEPVNTYTPMLWVSMNDDQRYQEYIRVRMKLTREAGSPALLPSASDAIAVKLAELMAAHRDGQTGSDCSDIDDPGSCDTCETLDAAIKALSAVDPPVLLPSLSQERTTEEDLARRAPQPLTDWREDSRPQPKGSER